MSPRKTLIASALACSLSSLAWGQAAAPAAPAASVREAVQKAVVGNPEVQARWHTFRAAMDEQDVAFGGYLPRVDLAAGVGKEHEHDTGLKDRHYTRRGVTLSLNQMVYDGFATASEVARLGYAKRARYFEVLDASENAALETLRAYEDVLRYRELVGFAQDNYVQHKQIFDQIRDRAQAGVGRRVDLEQASGRLALSESNLLTDATNLHDVSTRYQRLVGEIPAAALAPVQVATGDIPPAIADALRQAYTGSPAFNAAVENIRAAQAEVEGRRSRYHPRVDVRARSDVGHNLDGQIGHNNTQVVEVVLNYNLYNGGSDRAAERQFTERLNVAKDQRDRSCRDLRQTLSIAYNDVLRLEEQLRYLEQHQSSIAKARDAYRKQFDIGQRTLLDLLDTENEYFQARRAYVNGRYDHGVAQARTLAGMGRLLPALEVSRADLPSPASLGQEQEAVDPATACPAEAPGMVQIDKEALLAEALKKAPAK
jgi:adhesin transport system outer membrane protein